MSISDLYIEDLQKDTLFAAKEIDAHFSFWNFFKGKVIFTSVDLDGFHGNLVVDTAGHSNLDFLIKAFKNPQPSDSSNVEYKIDHFRIKNSSFNFTNHLSSVKVPENLFDANKLKFRNINLDLTLDKLNNDTLSARLLHLNAVEHSGLVISDFNTSVTGSSKGVHIPELELKLPKSDLMLQNVEFKFDSISDLKNLTEKVKMNAEIASSYVTLADLKAFVPNFVNISNKATLKGTISGRISSLKFQKVEVRYGKSFFFNADLDINGLPNLSEAFIYGQINDLNFEKNDLQDFISDISNKPFVLPKELNQLGLVRYKGNITGFLSNLVAYGNLNTNLGSISTDILLQLKNDLKDLYYNGTLKSNNFSLGRLLNNKQLGKVSFNINTDGSKLSDAPLQGNIKAQVPEFQFNKYSYKDIKFSGKYDGNGFDGKVDVKDENINAHFNGIIDMTKKLPVFNFDLRVLNTNLNALKLTDKYPGSKLSFKGSTNMVGNSLDNINGFIRFDSITFENQNNTLNIDKIQFISRIENNLTNFSISSDILNGSFSGDFRYSSISQTISQIVLNYLPAIAPNLKGKNKKYPNHINIDLSVANTENISNVLDLPYTLEGVSTIKGYIDDNTNRVDIQGNIPTLKSKKQKIDNITIHCENPQKQLKITTRAQGYEKEGGIINLFLLATAAKDSVDVRLGWQNAEQITNAGEIHAVSSFKNDDGKTSALLSIYPTQVIIADSVWNIRKCSIDLKADSTIHIHNFSFDNNKQFVHVNGVASKDINESVDVEMNDLDLEFVLSNLLRLKGIEIGGFATGVASIRNIMSQPIYEANLSVRGVNLNHKPVGDAKLYSTWDKLNKRVLANGTFVKDNDTVVVANGAFIPATDSLDFLFHARNFSIEFLDQYFESVVQNVKGWGTGDVRMYGPSKTLGFEGNVFVNKGEASVKMLKTTYFFNDTVRLTRKTIAFKNVTIYDKERNQGTMTGMVTHNGIFKDMKYDVRLKSKNILALNTHAEDNEYFFGKAYANGNVHIFGDEKEANILVDAISQPKTECYIQMGGASKASDNSFIKFVNKNVIVQNEPVVQKNPESGFNVKVDLQIEVTPEASMELLVDPKGGDRITGKGSGNLRVQFDTFSDISLFGTYTINSGYYLFTLQNVFRKEFKIDQGSTIAWTGSPYNAQVNIRALYPLTASLKDLAGNQFQDNMRSTVPVNCVLKLTDDLMKPTIKFDIDLPQSDENVKQMVRNIINTDEMMNREIFYLLLFNKFYTPDNANANASSFVTNEGFSLLTSTVGAQVNNWLSQMFTNVSVGFDYLQASQNTPTPEYQAQILYQPNNRLIINGNLGYKTDINSASSTTNRFIGDIDIEYLLNESGNLRFKAYNHTVDRYILSNTVLSQGVGFVYKEDFASWDDLAKYYWHLLTGNKKKNSNEETTTNNN